VESPPFALDVLEVTDTQARTWSFVWPGRIAIQPLRSGVASHCDGGPQPLRVGSALCAADNAARLIISTQPGAAFRVMFETRAVAPAGSSSRVHLPGVCESVSPGEPSAAFEQAMAQLASHSSTLELPTPVARARAYIERHLGDAFSLAAMSADAGSDRCHLCRSFGRLMGLTPYRYRMHMRVAHARLLFSAGHDCTHAAYATGFCDQSHLNRCFKAQTGTTPNSYMRACGQAHAPALAMANPTRDAERFAMSTVDCVTL
jgi:AraC-like DNA-binding protein